jgi:hypothetical protein
MLSGQVMAKQLSIPEIFYVNDVLMATIWPEVDIFDPYNDPRGLS